LIAEVVTNIGILSLPDLKGKFWTYNLLFGGETRSR